MSVTNMTFYMKIKTDLVYVKVRYIESGGD